MATDIVTSFRVDSELWKKVRIYAVEHDLTINEFIENLIIQDLLKNSTDCNTVERMNYHDRYSHER
jgi:predicted DNA-binding ribbon-helix-helix protein